MGRRTKGSKSEDETYLFPLHLMRNHHTPTHHQILESPAIREPLDMQQVLVVAVRVHGVVFVVGGRDFVPVEFGDVVPGVSFC